MRILRAISDLPWWTGLPIFFLGNFFTEGNTFFFVVGVIVCMFGSWIFSKLLNYKEGHVACSIIGIPAFIFFMVLCTDDKNIVQDAKLLFIFKATIGLLLSLLSISGFKRN